MITMTIGMGDMGAMTVTSATASGVAMVMIGMTDIMIATIGALMATVIGAIAGGMSEKEITTMTNVTRRGADGPRLCFLAAVTFKHRARVTSRPFKRHASKRQDSAMNSATVFRHCKIETSSSR